jgi:hypothetical protein
MSDEAIEAQYRRALPVIQKESEQLGRKSHFFGTARVRRTIAYQADLMTSEAIARFMQEISEKEKARARLSGWKRFITKGPSLADRELFSYLLSQRYLFTTLQSEPIEDAYQRSFLPVLIMHFSYSKKWFACFMSADGMRRVNLRKRQEQEREKYLEPQRRKEAQEREKDMEEQRQKKAQETKKCLEEKKATLELFKRRIADASAKPPQEVETRDIKALQEIQKRKASLEAVKARMEATKKQVLGAEGWLAVARFNVEFAKGFLGERRRLIKLATLMAINSLLKFPDRTARHALMALTNDLIFTIVDGIRLVSENQQQPEIRQHALEILELRKCISQISEEVQSIAFGVIRKNSVISADFDRLMKTRLAESSEGATKATEGLRKDCVSAIHRVEKQAAELLRWEFGVRGLSKVHRHHHPRTEGDIEWLWNALFQETAKGGVSHLLMQSVIIRAILSQSQFAGSIFRRVESERRSLAIRACEDQVQELLRWEQAAQELSQSPTFDHFQARLTIRPRWVNIFGRAYDRGYFDLAERSVVVQEALSRSSMANSIFKTQQSEPNPPLSLETASGFQSRQSLHS